MSMVRSSSDQRDWTNLPPDIVVAIGDTILSQELLPSYISLRRVCSAWRNATEDPATSSRRFLLHNWILIHPVPGVPESFPASASPISKIASKTQTLCRLLNSSTGNLVLVDIPQLRGYCVRACVDGFLLVSKVTKIGVDKTKFADTDAPTRLLNPFTGAFTDYPALSQLFCERCMFRQWLPRLLSIGFASSTSSNLMVVTRNEVAYAVPGSRQWKLVANHYPRDTINVAHAFFNGCAYVFSVTLISPHVKLRLTQFKVEEAHPNQVKLGVERLMIPQCPVSEHVRIGRGIVFLVESDGELLLLSRSYRSRLPDFFWVFKVVFEEGVSANGKANLVPLNNIGKRALIINKAYGSISVSTDVYPSLHPNSIYRYQDSLLTIYRPPVPRGPRREILNARGPPTSYWYRPRKKNKFTINPPSVFPDFGSQLGKRRRTGR